MMWHIRIRGVKHSVRGVRFEHRIVPRGSNPRRWKSPSSHQFWPNTLIRARVLKLKKLIARRRNIPRKASSKPLGPKDKIPRGRDVQVKKKGNFQVKYPPPHLMHCTNSTGHINSRMTPEQYHHNL